MENLDLKVIYINHDFMNRFFDPWTSRFLDFVLKFRNLKISNLNKS